MKTGTISVGLLTLFLMLFLVGSIMIHAQDQPTDKKTTNSVACCPGADQSKIKCAAAASCDTTACSVRNCSPTDKNCIKASNCNPNSANCKRICSGG